MTEGTVCYSSVVTAQSAFSKEHHEHTQSTIRARLAGMARWKKLVIGGGVALVAILAVGVWWFLRDDAPRVSLDAAVGA